MRARRGRGSPRAPARSFGPRGRRRRKRRRSSRRSASRPRAPQLTEKSAKHDLPRRAQGLGVAEALPREGPLDRRDLRQEVAGLGREGLVGQGRGDRFGTRRRRERFRPRGVDGAAGRVEDGARLLGRVRRDGDQQHLGLARVLRRLPDRARQPAPAALLAKPRPDRAALLLRLPLVLQRGRHLHQRSARVPADVLPRRPPDLDRLAAGGGKRVSARLAGLAARRRDGLPRRLPDRDQRGGAARRDRRRLLGRDRRRPDLERTVAVRPHADRGLPEAVRAGRLER